MSERPGKVFVAEVEAERPDGTGFIWTGSFDAHWESDDGREWRQGPEAVPVQAAIAWGRHQADVVLVRLGDSDVFQSAGAVAPATEDGPFPRWLDGTAVAARPVAEPAGDD